MRYIKLLILGICVAGGVRGSDGNDYQQSCEMKLADDADDLITNYVNADGDYVSNGKPIQKTVLELKEGFLVINHDKQTKVSILESTRLKQILEQLDQLYIVYLVKDKTLHPITGTEYLVDLHRQAFANKKTLVTIISSNATLSFVFDYPFKEGGTYKENSEYTISSLKYTNIDHTNIKKFILLLATFLYKLDLTLDPNLQQEILGQIENGYIV